MQSLIDFLLFVGKVLLLGFLAVLVIGNISRMVAAARGGRRTLVMNYRDAVRRNSDPLRHSAWSSANLKAYFKQQKAARKNVKRGELPRVWVLEFDGDASASGVPILKDEITAVLQIAQPQDQVMLRLNSSGGTVIGYGLAAAHLDRIRKASLPLTVSVDEAAASGGYLMAAVANEIIAAPFAVLGSIGVIATVPNAHKLLQDKGIEILEFTAGDFKRTVTPFSEVTEERRRKLLEQLADIHSLFKDFVAVRRPSLPIEDVATGEYWHGSRAQELGLVDKVQLSDEWLLERMDSHDIYLIRTLKPGAKMMQQVDRLMQAISGRLQGLAQPSGDDSATPRF